MGMTSFPHLFEICKSRALAFQTALPHVLFTGAGSLDIRQAGRPLASLWLPSIGCVSLVVGAAYFGLQRRWLQTESSVPGFLQQTRPLPAGLLILQWIAT